MPGGKASYPSSAIMNIAPAKVAGVKDIILASPCADGIYNPLMIYASSSMGIKKYCVWEVLKLLPLWRLEPSQSKRYVRLRDQEMNMLQKPKGKFLARLA